jgi:hypothetical protein
VLNAQQSRADEKVLVAGEENAAGLYRLREASTDRAQNEGGNAAFGFDGEAGCFLGKFQAAVELQPNFLKEFRGEAQILGAVDAPEPELLFIALEKRQGLLKLLHGPVKGGGEKKNAKIPGVTGVLNPDANTVFAGLILFDAATVVIPNAG